VRITHFILVTNNRKVSARPSGKDNMAEGRHIPGIFVLNSDFGIGQNIGGN
jgi:hypothetical protein